MASSNYSIFLFSLVAWFPRLICAKECSSSELGTLFLPLFQANGELAWPMPLRAILYGAGLLWAFMGVAIVADIFMESIEYITSQEKTIKRSDGATISVRVWNATVANLTLMALGSSAPEILLSVIEIVGNNFYSGELGPSTIVGSAAFNLLVIIAVCIVAVPASIQGGRKIGQLGVYAVTAVFSVLAYIWLLVILEFWTPDVVTITEALITLMCFPILVILAYLADKGYLAVGGQSLATHLVQIESHHEAITATIDMSMEQLIAELNRSFKTLSDDEKQRLIEYKAHQRAMKRSRAQYRVAATRNALGGKAPLPPAVTMDDQLKDRIVEVLEHAKTVESSSHGLQRVGFSCRNVSVLEGAGFIDVEVRRNKTKGPLMVDYATKGGTATPDVDYRTVSGTLNFRDGEAKKTIRIEIIDDDEVEDDEDFYVDLSNPRPDAALEIGLGSATVTIIDDDLPGCVGFATEETALTVVESEGEARVPVRRMDGASGSISVSFHTDDISAFAGNHYCAVEGNLSFEPGETVKYITIPIVDKGLHAVSHAFKVVVENPVLNCHSPLATKAPESTGIELVIQDKVSLAEHSEAIVTIVHDGETKAMLDKVLRRLNIDKAKYELGTSEWKEQFARALSVTGDDGEEEDNKGPISGWKYLLHFLSLPWKLLFALIPPTVYGGGWLCFATSISLIGVVTALIGDLATLFGCTLGVKNPVTAITFVALGTSLPDTFASQAAALGDPTADASIGNVTGSNSVNVFLGLGLPWTLAAIYWHITGASNDWKKRYGDKDTQTEGDDEFGAEKIGFDYPDGAFVVPAGSLASSVGVFCMCAGIALGVLSLRRAVLGFELGGPRPSAWGSAAVLVSLWLVYIIFSTLQEYGLLNF